MNSSQALQSGLGTVSYLLPVSGRKRFRKTPVCLQGVLLVALLLVGCAQGTAVAPGLYQEGKATLIYDIDSAKHPEAYLDLDTGSVVDNAEADIALRIDGGTNFYTVLLPINGAMKFRLAEKEGLSLDDCRENLDNLSTTNIPDFPPGTGICVLTNRGRFALLIIDSITAAEPGTSSVQVSFIVEGAPQP